MRIIKSCKYCDNKFETIISGKNSKKFCNSECYHKYLTKENHHAWNGGIVILSCELCKQSFQVKPYRKNCAKYCSSKCCNKAKMFIGDKNPAWKGGITSIKDKIRKSLEYKEWRKMIYERDNYTCQLCKNNISNTLQAHHIKRQKDFPELRFNLDNGITLCKKCHQKVNFHEKEYENQFHEMINNRKIVR